MQHATVTKTVSIADTAVDTQTMGAKVQDFLKSRDPKLIKIIPGKTPTWFHLRRIPTSIFQRYVATGESEGERRRRAFQCGVSRIDHLVREDGSVAPSVEPTDRIETPTGELRIWSERELEMLAPVFIEEIGSVVETQSFLPRGLAVYFQPPRLCLLAWVQRTSQDAAKILEAARQSNESPQPSSQPPEVDAPSDEATDAPAMESPTPESDGSPTSTSSVSGE